MNQTKIFRKKRNYLFLGIITLYFFIALFASLLANEKPLFFSNNGKYFFPAFSNNPYIELPDSAGVNKKFRKNNIDWKNITADLIIFAPVCWSPSHSDLLNTYSSPFDNQHYYKAG